MLKVLFFLLLPCHLLAQPKALTVGSPVPDLQFNQVLFSEKQATSLFLNTCGTM
jgi:hypothetical protein